MVGSRANSMTLLGMDKPSLSHLVTTGMSSLQRTVSNTQVVGIIESVGNTDLVLVALAGMKCLCKPCWPLVPTDTFWILRVMIKMWAPTPTLSLVL